jgi:hypothetical protein
MNIKYLSDLEEVVKVADASIKKDLVNWEWDYVNDEVKLKYSRKSAWIYFIVVDGVIRKVGGTGMKLVDRIRFYASANNWTDKPGYCNAATNPILFKYIQEGKSIEMYAVTEDVAGVWIEKVIMGEVEKIKVNVDFRPIEKMYRMKIEKYNQENNIQDEDLNLDGKALQRTLKMFGLKEVNIRENKRVQAGMKFIQQGKKWILSKI